MRRELRTFAAGVLVASLMGAASAPAATVDSYGGSTVAASPAAWLQSAVAAAGRQHRDRGAQRSRRGDRGQPGMERRRGADRDRHTAGGGDRRAARRHGDLDVSRSRERGEHYRSRTTTVTDESGRTATRTRRGEYDAESQTLTRSRETTGPEGRTRNFEGQHTRTEDGRQSRQTFTDAEGSTATRDVTVSRDSEAGSATRSTNLTARDGRTLERETTVTRTGDGFESQTVVTGPEGQSATRSSSGSYDAEAGSYTREVSATDAAGRTRERSTTTARTDDGFTSDTQIQGRAGGTATRSVEVARDPETGRVTREVTTSREPGDRGGENPEDGGSGGGDDGS